MKRWFLLAVLLLAGCGAPRPPTLPPDYLNKGATPYIAPSYPTAAAQAVSPEQATSGVDVEMARAWQDGKQLNAEVCFTLPDDSDWSIWKASLQYAGNVLSDFGTTLASLQAPANGQPGRRCDTLNFSIPPDADLTSASISIDAIAAVPREGEYCDIYLPKIQQALAARGIGITLACVDQNGVPTMQITGFPPEMTQQQAEEIVYSDEFYSIKGPWVFTFTVSQ
ncbi:MAG TPA: hypothetical protein VIU39_09145 [Anaerolineales bacterium]